MAHSIPRRLTSPEVLRKIDPRHLVEFLRPFSDYLALRKAKNKQLDNLNECARLIYSGMGYSVNAGYDFSVATHPQEITCFMLAVQTFNFWDSKTLKAKVVKKSAKNKDAIVKIIE